jgi:serine/threonine protein kinase
VPSFDPTAGELVHESERSRLTRVSLHGRTVIGKERLGPDAERASLHEASLLGRLRGVVGVAQLVDAPQEPGSIVLADAGERTEAEAEKPLGVEELIRLAEALTEAVAEMHRRRVIHRDIATANVVLSPDGAPCLAGFGFRDVTSGDPSRVHAPRRDRRDAGLRGARADRTEAVGGTLTVVSRAGRGARLLVELPLGPPRG